jgi:hypothetical protein
MRAISSLVGTPLVAAASATAAALAVAILAWPAHASGSATSHTLRITATRAAEVQFGKAGFTEADKVRTRAGRTLGTDVSDCTPVSSTKADCNGALGLKGGLLDARFSVNLANGHIAGTVTGGTRAYKQATGTIVGTSFNGGSHLTVTYRQ